MPEGPSIYIAKEIISPLLKGKKITAVRGNAKIDKEQFVGKKVTAIGSWGKHLLISFSEKTVRIHFLLFGSYGTNTQTKPDLGLRLALIAGKKSVFFYTCSVKILTDDLDVLYDWEADVMNDKWNKTKARKKIKAMPGKMVCDVLLDQDIFAGVGNIIKNEVLYRIKVHPETLIKNIPLRKLIALITEARNYSFDFLKWKNQFVLKKHWLAHTKKICSPCNLPFVKKYCGRTQRRSFFCENCQVKYE